MTHLLPEPEVTAAPAPTHNVPAYNASSLLRHVQPRMQVGRVDDPMEREADAVASHVVAAMSRVKTVAPPVADQDGGSRIQRRTDGWVASEMVPRSEAPIGSEACVGPLTRIRRRATIGAEGGELDEGTERALHSVSSSGAPLELRLQRRLETAFGGADFGGVRIHAGAQAAQLSESIQAKAFTTGSDVYFGADQYRPNSTDGLTTLAHELTHVVQQAPAVSRRINRLMSTATYQAQTVGPGRRGGSKASDIDGLLTTYATLNGSEVNVTKRKAALDVIKTKAAAYQVAKPGGPRTPGVVTLEQSVDTELSFIAPAADSIARRDTASLDAARQAIVGQDAFLAAKSAGHPVLSTQDPDWGKLLSSAMNAGDRKTIAAALIADDLAKLKALAVAGTTDQLLKDILTEVLANEGEMAFGEGALSSGASLSTGPQKALTGKDFKVDLNISSNPDGSAERLSSLVHEMTHVAVQTKFRNTAIHLAFGAGETDGTVLALSAKRTTQLADLAKDLTTTKEDFGPNRESLLRSKLEYPVTGKNTLKSYADTFSKKGDVPKADYDRIIGLVDQGANNTLIEFDTVINQMWFMLQQWGVSKTNAFSVRLEAVAREAHTYRTS